MIKHLKERRQSEEGFTLIELMVVVLIMGILMAIAIPTFLATQGSAHDAAAKSNATNAFTNEKAYYGDNQVFVTGAAALDSSLPWVAGTPTSADTVSATASGTAPASAVLIEALSKSGNCYYIADNELGTASYLAYGETSGGCVTTAPALPTAAPAVGTHAGTSVTGAVTWDASW